MVLIQLSHGPDLLHLGTALCANSRQKELRFILDLNVDGILLRLLRGPAAAAIKLARRAFVFPLGLPLIKKFDEFAAMDEMWPMVVNPNNVRDRILSDEETAKLFDAAVGGDDFVRPLFNVLYHTGMRLGEALALEWSDIQFDHQRIVIRRSKTGEGRKVPLRSALADEFIRWKPNARGSRWVFPARYDTSKPMQSIRKGWLRLCRSAGITDFRPHDLRHNFTSILQAQGISDSIIMSITGHKTHVMLHRYSHSNDQMRMQAVEGLPEPEVKESEGVIRLQS